jgi:hypothetical protein
MTYTGKMGFLNILHPLITTSVACFFSIPSDIIELKASLLEQVALFYDWLKNLHPINFLSITKERRFPYT